MPPAVPALSGLPGPRPVYWFPLALFGGLVALSVPLYAWQLHRSPVFSGWVSYASLSRTVSWSSLHGGYHSTFLATLNPDSGLAGFAEGWYWAAALTAGFLVTAVWYRRASRGGSAGPGWGYLVTGLLLTAAVTTVPILVMPRVSLPAWLWLSSQWVHGTFALLIIAVALGTLARRARSHPLAIVALVYTAAALVADWPALSSAPSAFTASGGSSLRILASIGPHAQSGMAALLPAAVLLVAAAVSAALPIRFRGPRQAG